jgi:hypothetical protein
MKHAWRIAVALGAVFTLVLPGTSIAETRDGTVVDGTTGTPIANATVTLGGGAVVTDAQGKYSIAGGTARAGPRARLSSRDDRSRR